MDDTGLPGSPRIVIAPRRAVDQRFARPHRDTPEAEFHPLTGERRLDKVVIADGGATKRDENVRSRLTRPENSGLQRRQIVGDDAQIERDATGLLDESGNRVAVRGDDLIRANGIARLHQLVASRDDGNKRFADDGYRRVIHRGGERDLGGAKPSARF